MNLDTKYSKTIGLGGGGKCRVYYSEKFKRKVVEKTIDDSFLRLKEGNHTCMKTMMTNYKNNEIFMKKKRILESILLVPKLDGCVEVLDFAENPFRIIMEYCEGGDVRKILDTYDVPIIDKLVIIFQFLMTLKRIHEKGCSHGNLKTTNIIKYYVTYTIFLMIL